MRQPTRKTKRHSAVAVQRVVGRQIIKCKYAPRAFTPREAEIAKAIFSGNLTGARTLLAALEEDEAANDPDERRSE